MGTLELLDVLLLSLLWTLVAYGLVWEVIGLALNEGCERLCSIVTGGWTSRQYHFEGYNIRIRCDMLSESRKVLLRYLSISE